MNAAVTYPQARSLTQGTIFSCAVAEDFPGCTTYGLVITARCDTANDKVRIYNYVPVVTLNDWLHRDGRILMSHRLMAETRGSIRAMIRDQKFSASILDTESPRSVLETLFTVGAVGQKLHKQFASLCERFELAEVAGGQDPPNGVCIRVANAAPRIKDSILLELANQKLTGYYFIARVDPDGGDQGHVALIREVQMIPRKVAKAVASGVDIHQFRELCGMEPTLNGRLRIEPHDLAMPIGLLRSPNLEHFMQAFSLLFGRIGIADPDPAYVANLWTRQPSIAEGP
jgi:hypothetical protein